MTNFARDIMSVPVVTVTPGTEASEIAEILVTRNISAVPVCTPDGGLRGMVSEADIVNPLRQAARLATGDWLRKLADGEALTDEGLAYPARDRRKAEDIMARVVIAADEYATIPELAELMVNHNVKRIPITRNNQVVGIVSRSDLLRAVVARPELVVD